jgi:hypothetical protein
LPISKTRWQGRIKGFRKLGKIHENKLAFSDWKARLDRESRGDAHAKKEKAMRNKG